MMPPDVREMLDRHSEPIFFAFLAGLDNERFDAAVKAGTAYDFEPHPSLPSVIALPLAYVRLVRALGPRERAEAAAITAIAEANKKGDRTAAMTLELRFRLDGLL